MSEEINLTLKGEILKDFYSILESLQRKTDSKVSYDDCLKFLITNYTRNRYVIYIPEEFKRAKEEWEKKNKKRITNNEFLELLVKNFRM
jgi:hypothetical protein